MLIKVTREHIDKGERKSSQKCAIALAMRDAGLPFPSVGGVRFTRNRYPNGLEGSFSGCKWEMLPDSAMDFRFRYDGYEFVAPFEFEIPDEAPISEVP